jgi:hypothetical protein
MTFNGEKIHIQTTGMLLFVDEESAQTSAPIIRDFIFETLGLIEEWEGVDERRGGWKPSEYIVSGPVVTFGIITSFVLDHTWVLDEIMRKAKELPGIVEINLPVLIQSRDMERYWRKDLSDKE